MQRTADISADDCGIRHNSGWRDLLVKWARSKGMGSSAESYDHMGSALRALICGDVIRPSLRWLTTPTTVRLLAEEMGRTRDPETFAQLDALSEPAADRVSSTRLDDQSRIATIWWPRAAPSSTSQSGTAWNC